jgi:hypothetical protein
MVFVGGYVLTLGVLIAVCRLKTVCSVLVKILVILLEVCVLSDRGTNFLFWKIIYAGWYVLKEERKKPHSSSRYFNWYSNTCHLCILDLRLAVSYRDRFMRMKIDNASLSVFMNGTPSPGRD